MSRWPHRRWISSAHHDAVCRVYADLADSTGPDERARRHADRSGWLPPIWWDTDRIDDPTYNPLTLDFTHDLDTDPVVIDRLIAGEAVQATKAERVQAIARLHERGKSYREIAQRVRVSVRQVHRDLQDLGLVGVSPYSPSRFLSVVVSTVDSVTDDASHAGAA